MQNMQPMLNWRKDLYRNNPLPQCYQPQPNNYWQEERAFEENL